jgi:hypothetical protein
MEGLGGVFPSFEIPLKLAIMMSRRKTVAQQTKVKRNNQLSGKPREA